LADVEDIKFLERIEKEVLLMGGGVKKGSIAKWELEASQEIRVSIRPPRQLSSTELFTLRKLEPGE
jgi:SpoU rRNA methylase family enzyme